jgi:gamma-butyrobetaine dioxygenase
MDSIDCILELFRTRGASDYFGEPVTQQEHALQAAHMATRDGAANPLVAAALLHDIGHLLGPQEDSGCFWLARHFGSEVTEPIRLHVVAKRYLCATDCVYLERLSPASLHSLELQGGPLGPEDVVRFEANPYYRDAIRLRWWDDAAKIEAWEVPGLHHYELLLRRLARG